MSCREHGYPWPSFAPFPYHPSLLAGLQGYIPWSSHSCCMYVRAGRPTFAWPYAVSCVSSSSNLYSFVTGGKRPYSWCLGGCCRPDLFNIARNILMWLPSSFFFSRLVSVRVVHPYSSTDTTAAWKKLRFILSVRSDFHMIDCFG